MNPEPVGRNSGSVFRRLCFTASYCVLPRLQRAEFFISRRTVREGDDAKRHPWRTTQSALRPAPGMTVGVVRCSSRPQHILLHLAAVEMEERHRRIVAQGAGGEALFEFVED